MTRCSHCGRQYNPDIPTYSHKACPACAFYTSAHGGILEKEFDIGLTVMQAFTAADALQHAKKSVICTVELAMLDDAIDALHRSIMGRWPMARNGWDRWRRKELEARWGIEEEFEVGEFDIEIEIEDM